VRRSLNHGLLGYLGQQGTQVSDHGKALGRLLADNDFDGFAERLKAFFAGVPYQWHGSGGLARYEAWCAGMLYACFQTIGLDLRVEDSSSHGRADMVVCHAGQVFVLEFKMAPDEGDEESALRSAMSQMRERGYAEQYRNRGEPIHLVGLAFGRTKRSLLGLRAEKA